MKIAIIVRKLNVRGGVQRHALALAREYEKKGHRVTLYTFLYDAEQCYADLTRGRRIVALGRYPKHVNILFDVLAENRAAAALARLIDPDTDILNPHDHVCYKVAAYFKKYVRSVPSVWTMHDMPTKTFGYTRRRELDPGFRRGFAMRMLYALVDAYEIRRFIRRQDALIVLDRRDKALARRFFGGTPVMVRNGIDIGMFPYHARKDVVSKQARILMNGIFFPHRRFEDGIEAVAILARRGYEAVLTITGNSASDTAYRERLFALAEQRGIRERVVFAGEIADAALVAAYQNADVFLFPNHLQSWGLAVFEAMACGAPVVVSRSAGAAEVLTDGLNALLVDPKSPAEIADAIARLIDDQALAARLSSAARAFVEREISWMRAADRMEEVFRRLIVSVV